MKSSARFKEIVKVLSSYGFGYIMDSKFNNCRKSPKNLREAFEKLGPTFIKIGQILSTRPDLLSKEYITELAKLQDSAPAEDFECIEEVFFEEFGKSINESFLFLLKKPIASASIAQVHHGILLDGREVIVKIQRKNVLEIMKRDIAILRRLSKLAEGKVEYVDTKDVINELEETTIKELDFLLEGENILKFKENNRDLSSIYAPNVISELTGKRVLTLEYIDGFKINNLEMIDSNGYNRRNIARKLALSYCKQVFDDGFFHGDPHPGNLLISEGKICFIDFGIVGEIDYGLKTWFNKALIAMATGDKEGLVEFILAIGIKRGKVNKGELYEDVSYLFTTYLSTSLKNIKIAELVQEVIEIVQKNNIQLPKELVVLCRGLIILEGVVAEVDPQLDVISVITTFVKGKGKKIFLRNIDKEELFVSAYSILRDTSKIPTKALEAISTIADGRAKINFTVTDLEETVLHLSNMVNRVVASLIIASLIVSSSLIISNNVGPIYKGLSLIGVIGYVISGIFAICLLFAVLKDGGFRTKKKKRKF